MSLVNFRVDPELKKQAFKIIGELGSNPTEVFKNVMKYIVENNQLPLQEILMPNTDTEFKSFSTGHSPSMRNVFSHTHNRFKNAKNSVVCGNIDSGYLNGVDSAIQNYITKGKAVFVAHPLLSTSKVFIDQIMEHASLYCRDLYILNLDCLADASIKPQVVYNPFHGKTIHQVLQMVLLLNPQIDIPSANFYISKVITYALKGLEGFDSLNFKDVLAWANHYNNFDSDGESQVDDDLCAVGLDAIDLIRSGCELVLKSPLYDLVNDQDVPEDQLFKFSNLYDSNSIFLIKHKEGVDLSQSLPLLNILLSLDWTFTTDRLIDTLSECPEASLFVTSLDYVFSNECIANFTRTSRKLNTSTITTLPEIAHIKAESFLSCYRIFQQAHNLFVFNSDGAQIAPINNHVLYEKVVKEANKLAITKFIYFSVEHFSLEIFNK